MKIFTYGTFIFLLTVFLLVPANLTAARIISVSLCEEVDQSGTVPVNIREQFSTSVPEIHALIEVSEMQPGTRIKGTWISIDAINVPNYEIDAAETVLNQSEGVVHFSLSRPTNGWPVGNYKLDIYLNGKLSTIASFSIGGNATGPAGEINATAPPSPSPQKSVTDQSTGFQGEYLMNSQGITLYLNLQQTAQGQIAGSLSSSVGMSYQLEGEVKDNLAMGVCYDNQGGIFFEAYFQGNQLIFGMIEPDANNMPDYSRSKQLIFTRQGSVPVENPIPQQPPNQSVASGREYLLQGTLCSWSGSSSGYGNSSYSSSTRVYFDGQGNFSYSSESSFSGDAGMAYGGNQGTGNGGTYRVVGNQVYLQFNDGTSGIAQINMQQDDGRITELLYDGTLYATSLCE